MVDAGTIGHPPAKGMNLSPSPGPYSKIHSKWILDQNVTPKILEENIEENLCDWV